MLVVGFPTGALQANCYLVAPGEGEPCVIVDPGQDAVEPITEALRKHRLSPVAVLLTHGHFDHCLLAWRRSATATTSPPGSTPRTAACSPTRCRASAPAREFFGGKLEMREPAEVRELADGTDLDLAGLTLTVDHTPGHTRGSVVFRSELDEGGRVVFAGDTLFAGSIGRTDLPGGDMRTHDHTLRTKLLPLADDTVVLPGHGPSTTIGRERASNPFLLGLDDRATPRATGPSRGL